LVFRRMEDDPADHVPGRVPLGEPAREIVTFEIGLERAVEIAPELFEDGGRQVLGAGHRRRASRAPLQLVRWRSRRALAADRTQVERGDIAEEAQAGRQGLAGMPR